MFRSLEAFGQGPPVDESLLLVFVILNNTCKHYVVSAHLSLQGKETWLFQPRASAIWFGSYSSTESTKTARFPLEGLPTLGSIYESVLVNWIYLEIYMASESAQTVF